MQELGTLFALERPLTVVTDMLRDSLFASRSFAAVQERLHMCYL